MGTDQTDIEKKTRQQHQQLEQLDTSVYCGNTKGVSDNIAMVAHTCVCLIVGTLRLFMFHKAIRKVFEFFLFDRTLFSLLPSLQKKGGAANETQ